MNATDLCLIIDNDHEFLSAMLAKTRREIPQGNWTADTCGSFLLTAVEKLGFIARGTTAARTGETMPAKMAVDLAHLAIQRVDWAEVAEHYRIKVEEGVTV
jgi:hypothetical protein